MGQAVMITLGGAIGTGVRYVATVLALRYLGPDFPYGTLAVNLSGAFLVGLVQGLALATLLVPEGLRLFITVGVLGGMTTYSAFTYETVRLMTVGAWGKALANILVTNALCLALCWLGIAVARSLPGPSS